MSNKPLNGKVAIVTGATAGIGLAIATRLGRDGAKVVLCSRKRENVEKAVENLHKEKVDAQGVVCHVAKPNDRIGLIDFALQKYGRIDILVNNAAINPHFGSLLDVTEEIWDRLFAANVKAGFLLSQQVIPYMEKQGGGNIVFVSSTAGFVPTELWENEELLQSRQHQIPLNRMGTPEECSGIVAFLCSNEASYITGENIVVNGGLHSRL